MDIKSDTTPITLTARLVTGDIAEIHGAETDPWNVSTFSPREILLDSIRRGGFVDGTIAGKPVMIATQHIVWIEG